MVDDGESGGGEVGGVEKDARGEAHHAGLHQAPTVFRRCLGTDVDGAEVGSISVGVTIHAPTCSDAKFVSSTLNTRLSSLTSTLLSFFLFFNTSELLNHQHC
jgi:hypothetical protein